MQLHRILRHATAAAMVIGTSLMTPALLEATCRIQYTDPSRTDIKSMTCCGSTSCCTTRWDGPTLVSTVCEP